MKRNKKTGFSLIEKKRMNIQNLSISKMIFYGVIIILSIVCILWIKNQVIVQKNTDVDTKEGYDKLTKLDGISVQKAQQKLVEMQEKMQNYVKPDSQCLKWKTNPVTLSVLKKKYENSVFIGDSFIEGMSDYEILYSDEIVYKRGCCIWQADELIEQAIALQPRNVFFMFGINDMEYYGNNVEKYVQDYVIQIRKIKEALPNTRICICGLIPVQQFAINRNPALGNSALFNEALEKMCEEQGIIFADSTAIIAGRDDLYEEDGQHPAYAYYALWLTFLGEKLGLI